MSLGEERKRVWSFEAERAHQRRGSMQDTMKMLTKGFVAAGKRHSPYIGDCGGSCLYRWRDAVRERQLARDSWILEQHDGGDNFAAVWLRRNSPLRASQSADEQGPRETRPRDSPRNARPAATCTSRHTIDLGSDVAITLGTLSRQCNSSSFRHFGRVKELTPEHDRAFGSEAGGAAGTGRGQLPTDFGLFAGPLRL